MPSVDDYGGLAAFAGLMALGQFSPGPDLLLVTRTSLREGSAAGCAAALGIACGLTVHTVLAVGGVAVALQRASGPAVAVRWAGAAYLLWLACGMVREGVAAWRSGGAAGTDAGRSSRPPFLRGLFCNLLNPKAALFLAAASAPFLSGDRPGWWPFAIGGIVVGQGLVLWLLWVFLLRWPPLRGGYERLSPVIDLLFGIALAALALVWLAGG